MRLGDALLSAPCPSLSTSPASLFLLLADVAKLHHKSASLRASHSAAVYTNADITVMGKHHGGDESFSLDTQRCHDHRCHRTSAHHALPEAVGHLPSHSGSRAPLAGLSSCSQPILCTAHITVILERRRQSSLLLLWRHNVQSTKLWSVCSSVSLCVRLSAYVVTCVQEKQTTTKKRIFERSGTIKIDWTRVYEERHNSGFYVLKDVLILL